MPRQFLLLLTCLSIAGCAKFAPPTDMQRTQSFQPLSQARVGDESLETFLRQRTAAIIGGSLAVTEAQANGQTIAIRFKAEPDKLLRGPSRAIAIDSRGYFLTAAHCLEDPFNYLVYSDGTSARIAALRIVAKIKDEKTHLDFAIIHVDATVPYIFAWSGAAKDLQGNSAAAVGGASLYAISDSLAYDAPMCMAGRIISTTDAANGAVLIAHNVPIRFGDSGGPLATADGRLLGINIFGHLSWTGTMTNYAIRPDPAWITQTIAKDLQEPITSPPSISSPLQDKRKANLIITLW